MVLSSPRKVPSVEGGTSAGVALAVVTAVMITALAVGNAAASPPRPGLVPSLYPIEVRPLGANPVVPTQDTTPPVTTVRLEGDRGTGEWYISSVTVTLTAQDDVAVASTWYHLNGGGWEEYSLPFSVDQDGFNTVDFYSVDTEGNPEAPNTTTIQLDRSPPVIVEISPTGLVTQSEVTLRWNATDATSGVASYDVSIDSGPFDPLGRQESRVVTLADGDHTIRVRAWDAAGLSSESEISLRVDTSLLRATRPGSDLVYVLVFGVNTAIVAAALLLRRRKRR